MGELSERGVNGFELDADLLFFSLTKGRSMGVKQAVEVGGGGWVDWSGNYLWARLGRGAS